MAVLGAARGAVEPVGVRVVREDDGSAAPRGAWLAIGNFDGLHGGHRRLVAELTERARTDGADAAIMTFTPHPAAVLSPRGAPPRLLSDAQQEEILASWGVDAVLRRRFDASFASLGAEEFVRSVLGIELGVRGVVVGRRFRFGRDRLGDFAALQRLLAETSALAVAVDPVEANGAVISSSRIRRLVAEGDLAGARELLGRPFVLEGVVVRGDGRGRTLGVPTANVEAPGHAIPAPGVHACMARCGDGVLEAVANIGTRPTFGGTRQHVEVHVLGEPGDLYGRTVRVGFFERLREERRFESVESLVEQIRRDVAAARAALARSGARELMDAAGC